MMRRFYAPREFLGLFFRYAQASPLFSIKERYSRNEGEFPDRFPLGPA